jgi:cathepsin H
MWTQFKADYESQSPVALDQEAMFNFFETVDKIITHNKKTEKTYTKGINAFSAMTFEQVSEHFHFNENKKNAPQNCSATRSSPLTAESNDDDVPDTWDWTKHGGVSPVKDQGNCGSCWTFSTVGCLESAHLIKYGRLETYAEQQLVDCAGAFDNFGCDGGLPSHAFEYVNFTGGISTEAAYPYFGKDNTCTVDTSTFKLSVGHAQNITVGDETELKAAVYK